MSEIPLDRQEEVLSFLLAAGFNEEAAALFAFCSSGLTLANCEVEVRIKPPASPQTFSLPLASVRCDYLPPTGGPFGPPALAAPPKFALIRVIALSEPQLVSAPEI